MKGNNQKTSLEQKQYKICNFLGGLDVTRSVSSTTRVVFQQAIEDVELIRESVSQAALLEFLNNRQQEQKQEGKTSLLDKLAKSLQWKQRGFSQPKTSLQANLGYVDDTPHRVVERFVSTANRPFVGTKETDLQLVQSLASIFPWIVDRRSIERNWCTRHQNGRSEGPDKEPFLFDSLYSAAWIGTYGEAWVYYPPFYVFSPDHPLTVGDVAGGDLDSHEYVFVNPNLPEHNSLRYVQILPPYPDIAQPGLSLISVIAPVYLTGTFGGYTYQDTYIASTGVDIALDSVSTLLDVLLDSMVETSFAILVSTESFSTICISKTVVQRLYPARTGFEDERVTYHPATGEVLSDRRNQSYTVADTIHQSLLNLTNANWTKLWHEVQENVPRGVRNMMPLNITLTGADMEIEFFVMIERWNTQADWVLLAFAPKAQVEGAIDVVFTNEKINRTTLNSSVTGNSDTRGEATMTSKNSTTSTIASFDPLHMEGERGKELVARAALKNRGTLDVTVTVKDHPSWMTVSLFNDMDDDESDDGSQNQMTLPADSILPMSLSVSTQALDVGTSSISLTFTIQDDKYPDCYYNQDISLPITIKVLPKDCVSLTGDRLRIASPRTQECICRNDAFEFSSRCWSQWMLLPLVLILFIMIGWKVLHLYIDHKKKQADCVWSISTSDLIFDDPPNVLGRGTFGLVVLAEYRGTQVAVKRVIPPRDVVLATPQKRSFARDGLTKKDLGYFEFRKENNEESGLDSEDGVTVMTTSTSTSADIEAVAAPRRVPQQRRGSMRALLANHQRSPIREEGKSSRRLLGFVSTSSTITLENNHEKLKADFVEEMRLLSKLRHPCITTVMGAVVSKWEEPLLVMEYMDHGSLFDLLQNETIGILDGHTMLPILRDISQGLRFLHAANPQVIHGDLKAQNILVDSKFRAKVADFGLSQKKQVGACGTPFWMAPELLRGESPNSAASDVYSFGIVLYEVYSRRAPYDTEEDAIHDDDQILAHICDPDINKRPDAPQSMPQDVVTLMAECVDADPSARPTFRDIDHRLKEFKVDSVEPGRVAYSMQLRKQMDAATNLLNEIFPQHIAEALASGRRVEPEHFDCVTIFFSDIVGFTTICSDLTPIKVSDLLDRLYLKFDSLSKLHGVFKVETIGDAWMGVTNLASSQQSDHTQRIAEFAADAIRAASATLVDTTDPSRGCVKLRVGFHSGPVVANVVGTASPRYTLIGDTVNTSSRMESNSSPGRILCSDKAANLLMKQCPRIPLTFRGEIEVKGKGKMGTFWVSTDIHRTETKAVAGTTNGSLSLASTKHGGVRFAGENWPLLG